MAKTFHTGHRKHEVFTTVIHKDANHTVIFHCCHGAVGQDCHRSRSRLSYHMCHLVAQVVPFWAEIHVFEHTGISLAQASGGIETICIITEAWFGRETKNADEQKLRPPATKTWIVSFFCPLACFLSRSIYTRYVHFLIAHNYSCLFSPQNNMSFELFLKTLHFIYFQAPTFAS